MTNSATLQSVLKIMIAAMAIGLMLSFCAQARPLRHHVHNHITQPREVDYNCQHCPMAARLALCAYWAKQARGKAIAIDESFISTNEARHLTAMGFPIERRPLKDNQDSNSKTIEHGYAPNYFWQDGKDKIDWCYDHLRLDGNVQDDNMLAWIEVVRVSDKWQVRELRRTELPIPIQVMICKEIIWKPEKNRILHLYVNDPIKLKPFLTDSYIQIESIDKYRDLQWTDQAYISRLLRYHMARQF